MGTSNSSVRTSGVYVSHGFPLASAKLWFHDQHKCPAEYTFAAFVFMVSYKILVGGYTSALTTLSFTSGNTNLPTVSTISTTNPSWITAHPTNKSVIFATQDSYFGGVQSFLVGSQGQLTKIASVSTGGDSPAHMIVSKDGNEIVVMNYNSGTGLNVPLTGDKSRFGTAYPIIKFTGSGPNPSRQTSSHPHAIIQYGNEYLVPDLGSDKIWRLTKSSSGALQNSGYIQQPLGSGPRHGVIDGNTLYTIHELSNTVIQQTIPALGSNSQAPIIANISILPTDSNNPSAHTAAELILSPVTSAFPKQYLYATNRGDSSDAITIIDPANNGLRIVKQFRTGLSSMRGAALSPDGTYLVTGGQYNGLVVVYERINGGADLKEVARASGFNQPFSFLWNFMTSVFTCVYIVFKQWKRARPLLLVWTIPTMISKFSLPITQL
ncbi:isomerase YbhE, partial [Rhizoctonia solani]